MFNSTKLVLGLAVASAAVAGLFYWWWMRLIIGTFSICAGGDPGVGVDCRHIFQFYAAILFSAITLILLLVAVIRAMRSARGRAAPAEYGAADTEALSGGRAGLSTTTVGQSKDIRR